MDCIDLQLSLIFFQIIGKWNENLMMNVSGKGLDALTFLQCCKNDKTSFQIIFVQYVDFQM